MPRTCCVTAFSVVVTRLCIIAGDISPIDVISHLPVFCEENEVPYVFVTSKVCSLRLHCLTPDVHRYAAIDCRNRPSICAFMNTWFV